MTKINFDMNSLYSSVLPSLDKTIGSLDVLINKCSSLYIPRNFKYRSYLTNLVNDNISIKKSVNSTKELIYNTNKAYESFMDIIISTGRTLNNIQIGKKYSSIK